MRPFRPALALIPFLPVPLAAAQLGVEEPAQLLTVTSSSGGELFGSAVAAGDEALVVGTGADDLAGDDSGLARLYEIYTDDYFGDSYWQLEATLRTPDDPYGAQFGAKVAIDGDLAAVAAPALDTGAASGRGQVSIYERVGPVWVFVETLESVDFPLLTPFGLDLDLDGDTLAVGMGRGQSPFFGPFDGGVALFRRVGGSFVHEQTLQPVHATGSAEEFGTTLDLDGDTLVVGARDLIIGALFEPGAHEGAAFVFERAAGVWTQTALLSEPAGGFADDYARSVAVSGDRIAVGAPEYGGGGTTSGRVYVYQRSGSDWSPLTTLFASDLVQFEDFGHAVAMDGDRILVGCPFHPLGRGAGYVFEAGVESILVPPEGSVGASHGLDVQIDGDRVVLGSASTYAGEGAYLFERIGGTWQPSQDLIPFASSFTYGASVGVSGNAVVVGAPRGEGSALNSGYAAFFQSVGGPFGPIQTMAPVNAAIGDRHGESVAAGGGYVATGAPGDATLGADSGTVFVWREQYGTLVDRVFASDASAGDEFGSAVAIDGPVLAVAARSDDAGGTGAGSVYVFEELAPDFVESAKLLGSDTDAGDEFGAALDVEGLRLAIGAPEADGVSPGAGAVYLFELVGGTWTQVAKVVALDGESGDRFGHALCLDGDALHVGAPSDDAAGDGAGGVYTFQLVGGNWAFTRWTTAPDVAAGDGFGSGLAARGERIVVGSPGADGALPDEGAAYSMVNCGNAFQVLSKYVAASPAPDSGFGTTVAVSSTRSMVAAPLDDQGPTQVDTGSVAVFENPYGPLTEPILIQSESTLDLSDGGTIDWRICAGTPAEGGFYLVLGTLGGTWPGLDLGGGIVLPLTVDSYFTLMLTAANQPPFQNTFGALDAGGAGAASMTIPGGLYSFFETGYHAFLGFDAFGVIRVASPAEPLYWRP